MLLFDVAIGGLPLLISVLGIVIAVLALIFITRTLLAKQTDKSLSEGVGSESGHTSHAGRAKYPEADVFRLSGSFFGLGMALALGLSVLAFGWTQYEKQIDVSKYLDTLDDEIEVEDIPRTAEPPPPPPPPPPPIIQEVPEEEILEEEQPKFVDQSVDETTVVEQVKPTPGPPPPPNRAAMKLMKAITR